MLLTIPSFGLTLLYYFPTLIGGYFYDKNKLTKKIKTLDNIRTNTQAEIEQIREIDEGLEERMDESPSVESKRTLSESGRRKHLIEQKGERVSEELSREEEEAKLIKEEKPK